MLAWEIGSRTTLTRHASRPNLQMAGHDMVIHTIQPRDISQPANPVIFGEREAVCASTLYARKVPSKLLLRRVLRVLRVTSRASKLLVHGQNRVRVLERRSRRTMLRVMVSNAIGLSFLFFFALFSTLYKGIKTALARIAFFVFEIEFVPLTQLSLGAYQSMILKRDGSLWSTGTCHVYGRKSVCMCV